MLVRRPITEVDVAVAVRSDGQLVVGMNSRVFLEQQGDFTVRPPSRACDNRPLVWRVVILVRLDRREAITFSIPNRNRLTVRICRRPSSDDRKAINFRGSA